MGTNLGSTASEPHFLLINPSLNMTSVRDFNQEIKDNSGRNYFYGFDYDVMHPYMISSFKPFFKDGSLLELGSYKGFFTKRLLQHFSDITCVEASSDAILEAKDLLGDNVKFVNSMFEDLVLEHSFNNIILTHVLEHLDDPVGILTE